MNCTCLEVRHAEVQSKDSRIRIVVERRRRPSILMLPDGRGDWTGSGQKGHLCAAFNAGKVH